MLFYHGSAIEMQTGTMIHEQWTWKDKEQGRRVLLSHACNQESARKRGQRIRTHLRSASFKRGSSPSCFHLHTNHQSGRRTFYVTSSGF
jgi:hypothetical protein